jgi:cytoskeletal protein CcmA (bactofilin family)
VFSPTVIPPHTRFDGRIETPADVTIEGRCDGEVAAGGTVIVVANATCRADIRARRAEILGEVIGSIVCSESVTVGAGARVVGDLRAPDIAVDPSAKVEGRVDLLAPAPEEAAVRRSRIDPKNSGGLRRPSAPSPISQLLEANARVDEFEADVPTVDERAKLKRRTIPKPPRPRGRSRVVQKPPTTATEDAE